MKIAEAMKLLEGITYKPDVELMFFWMPGGGLSLQITGDTFDASDPNKHINVRGGQSLTAYDLENFLDREGLLDWVRSTVRGFESHEIDEWLKIGGEHIRDPHPGLAEAS